MVQTQKIDVVPAALTQGIELRQSVAVSVEIRDAVRQSHGDSLLFLYFQGDNPSVTACAVTAPLSGEPSGFAKNGLASPNRGGGKTKFLTEGVFLV